MSMQTVNDFQYVALNWRSIKMPASFGSHKSGRQYGKTHCTSNVAHKEQSPNKNVWISADLFLRFLIWEAAVPLQ